MGGLVFTANIFSCISEHFLLRFKTLRSNTEHRRNKNAFQKDVYRPLVDRIPACIAGGVYLPMGGGPAQVLPPVNRITDTCKNITLPQTTSNSPNKARLKGFDS